MKKFILLAICLIGLNSCGPLEEKEIINVEKSGIRLKVDDYIFYDFNIVRFSYDEHGYIWFRNNGKSIILHDPDCKCLQEKRDELSY